MITRCWGWVLIGSYAISRFGLQTRKKNCTEKENLKKGDLVYLAEDNIPALQWPLGLIIDVFTGNDNLVRVAKVKTSAEKTIIRPITKLRKLPLA